MMCDLCDNVEYWFYMLEIKMISLPEEKVMRCVALSVICVFPSHAV